MLPKANRLPGKLIPQLKKSGNYRGSNLATAIVAKSNQRFFRVAISVSAKVSKKAVDRNRLKRRFRHAFSQHLPICPQGVDMVVIPKKAALSASFSAIKKVVEKLAQDRSYPNETT